MRVLDDHPLHLGRLFPELPLVCRAGQPFLHSADDGCHERGLRHVFRQRHDLQKLWLDRLEDSMECEQDQAFLGLRPVAGGHDELVEHGLRHGHLARLGGGVGEGLHPARGGVQPMHSGKAFHVAGVVRLDYFNLCELRLWLPPGLGRRREHREHLSRLFMCRRFGRLLVLDVALDGEIFEGRDGPLHHAEGAAGFRQRHLLDLILAGDGLVGRDAGQSEDGRRLLGQALWPRLLGVPGDRPANSAPLRPQWMRPVYRRVPCGFG
mmetsp:Transcript_36568/g.105360  ORF Transcript_36568/g.105360 Transcript_36568/m.105360 type:complete len:265 (+) Transcript_36568:1748-2542(+)